MSPPSYVDLGKSARDVFGKGFHFGLVKLDVKSKTSSGIELSSGGQSNIDSGKVSYLMSDHCHSFSDQNIAGIW